MKDGLGVFRVKGERGGSYPRAYAQLCDEVLCPTPPFPASA